MNPNQLASEIPPCCDNENASSRIRSARLKSGLVWSRKRDRFTAQNVIFDMNGQSDGGGHQLSENMSSDRLAVVLW